MKKDKKIYLIRESDDGFENSKVIGSFDNFELAEAAIDELQTYSKFADNGKRYIIEYFDICNSLLDLDCPVGRPDSLYFGYTPDGDLFGDFSCLNGKPYSKKMLVVDVKPEGIDNDIMMVVRVKIDDNDTPDDVKEKGSLISNNLFNSIREMIDLYILRKVNSTTTLKQLGFTKVTTFGDNIEHFVMEIE